MSEIEGVRGDQLLIAERPGNAHTAAASTNSGTTGVRARDVDRLVVRESSDAPQQPREIFAVPPSEFSSAMAVTLNGKMSPSSFRIG